MKKHLIFLLTVFAMLFAINQANAKAKEDIGVTPRQFSKRVNVYLKNLDFPVQMPLNIKTRKGEVNNIAQVMLTENLTVFLSVNKRTGNVKGVITNMTPTNNTETNLMLFAANSAVMAAFAGKNELEKLGKEFLLLNLDVMQAFFEATDKTEGTKKEMMYKGIKFGMMANTTIGVISYAQPEEK